MSAWFKNYRLEWIRDAVTICGTINRDHIKNKFGVSTPQASLDIRDAMTRWPNLMEYNRSAKRYERKAPHQ